MDKLNFLTIDQLSQINQTFSTPCYVYSEKVLKQQALKLLDFPNAFGLRVRYAMKACPNKNILKIFDNMGVYIDASSEHEVLRAMDAGIQPENIQLTSQQSPSDLDSLLKKGILYNATSFLQLENYGKTNPGGELSVRINPGLGSGGTNRTNVGGPGSSFGIWHEYIDRVLEIAQKYNLSIIRLHTHIGSGSDPDVWAKVSIMSLEIAKNFPNVKVLNLGGGFKVGRMPGEDDADLQKVGNKVKQAFENFNKETGRELKLEIEPGTYLVANSCSIISKVQDVCDTGKDGYKFLKLDSGMTELTRISLYGAQHPIIVVNNSDQREDYIVVGHCCESGDILTPAPGDPEGLKVRNLKKADIGDLVVIEGAGAYGSAMSTKNYNSYPEAGELLVRESGEIVEIRTIEKVEDIWRNEVSVII